MSAGDQERGAAPPVPDLVQRQRALDIHNSCIVQAPAGSGKTTLLAQRYVNLLAAVQRPEEILAITFTKKAAAEMRHRVMALLQDDSPAATRVRGRDRELGWQLFSNPGLMKIQTIDSFAMELASQTPAAVSGSPHDSRHAAAGGVNVTTQPGAYYHAAVDGLINALLEDQQSAAVIADFVAALDNDAAKVRRLLLSMLERRDQWLDVVLAVATARQPAELSRLLNRAVHHLRESMSQRLNEHLHGGDHDQLQSLAQLTGVTGGAAALAPLLVTKSGTLRKRIPSELVADAGQRRLFNQWLEDLHTRNLAPLLANCARLPGELRSGQADEDTQLLTLCCICLSLVVVELERVFNRQGVTDFTGLLLQARAALGETDAPTDLALFLDFRIRHLLIDEYQDTSRAQAGFFAQLTAGWQPGDGNSVFVVGDPMQSIYRFRDADVAVFSETQHTGLSGKTLENIALSANFRSDRAVIDWCNHVFADLFGSGGAPELGEVPYNAAVAMAADRPGAGASCIHFEDADAESAYVLDRITTLLQQDPGASIAILCRVRSHVTPLLSLLRANRVEYSATEMESLAGKPVVADLMQLHQALLVPDDQLAWTAILRSPMFGLSLKELVRLRGAGPLPGVLDNSNPAQQRLLTAMHWARQNLDERSLREVLEGLWLRCGGVDAYPANQHPQARAWFDLVEDLQTGAYEPRTLQQALAELYAPAETTASVQVMTIHKAKGLEFDHVIVPNLERRAQSDDSELLSWRPSPAGLLMGVQGDAIHRWLRFEDGERSRNEEKRLLYVACTRARQSLLLTYVQPPKAKPAGMARLIAPFAGSSADAGTAVSAAGGGQAELFAGTSQMLQRLPAGYRWRAPAYTPVAAGRADAPQPADVIGERREVAVGNLVHRCLAWYATAPAALRADWQSHMPRWAEAMDVPRDLLNAIVTEAAAHMQRVLADSTGRWLLDAHDQAASELPLAGLSQNKIINVVMDRTFVEDGRRWVVDYKTAKPPAEITQQDFIAQQCSRYRPQLDRYRRLAETAYGQPVRAALYFTAIPHLEELPPDG